MTGVVNDVVTSPLVTSGTVVSDRVEGPPGGGAVPGTTVFDAPWTGVDGATAYVEESSNAASATFVGGAHIEDTEFFSAPTSLRVDGVGEYVTFPDIPAYTLGGSDFEITNQVRFSALAMGGNVHYIISQFRSVPLSDRAFALLYVEPPSGFLRFLYNLIPVDRPWAPVINTWYKLTVRRVGDSLTMLVDDVPLGAPHDMTGVVIVDSPRPLMFAAIDTGSGIAGFLNGYIDDSKIVIG